LPRFLTKRGYRGTSDNYAGHDPERSAARQSGTRPTEGIVRCREGLACRFRATVGRESDCVFRQADEGFRVSYAQNERQSLKWRGYGKGRAVPCGTGTLRALRDNPRGGRENDCGRNCATTRKRLERDRRKRRRKRLSQTTKIGAIRNPKP